MEIVVVHTYRHKQRFACTVDSTYRFTCLVEKSIIFYYIVLIDRARAHVLASMLDNSILGLCWSCALIRYERASMSMCAFFSLPPQFALPLDYYYYHHHSSKLVLYLHCICWCCYCCWLFCLLSVSNTCWYYCL